MYGKRDIIYMWFSENIVLLNSKSFYCLSILLLWFSFFFFFLKVPFQFKVEWKERRFLRGVDLIQSFTSLAS